MRWIVLVAVALAACTSPATPSASPQPSAPAAPGVVVPSTAARELPAAEPVLPSLRQFRAHAEQACVTAARQVDAVALRGDPLRSGASSADIRAAVQHYRARAAAFIGAADALWTFGVPRGRSGRALITTLDTVGQYSQQTAQFLADGDLSTAQAGVAAVEDSIAKADAIARRIGMTPVSECGVARGRLRDAQIVRVDAFDFGFGAQDVEAGPTQFVLRNAGREAHHLFVVGLQAPGTLADAVRADRAGNAPGGFLSGQGAESPTAAPGERTTLDVKLRSGSYGLLCFVASEDGTPHAYKGMAQEIFVP